ncbi:MAG: hypothetical protein SRB2_00564 [Desulfobacteraceae bacterium Eth-SRB2]|nr:MAG: hypothetical protein SRB2_00564 [Desulfobacteraceae bacterium Eth-SRB2]
MYIQQSDLFWGYEKRSFVKEVMNIGEKERILSQRRLSLSEGDPAVRFYILIKGRVKLAIRVRPGGWFIPWIVPERLLAGRV